MEIVSGKVTLRLLTTKELESLVYNTAEFEEALGVSCYSLTLEGEFHEVLKIKHSILEQFPKERVFNGLWLILVDSDAVGSIGFKGVPQQDGMVEIGYSVGEDFRRRGYAAMAVKALSSWVVKRSDVRGVLAETLSANIPSQKVLMKAGFHTYPVEKENMWWIYEGTD